MLKLAQVLTLLGRHNQYLAMGKKEDEEGPSHEQMRWAFLIKPQEIGPLVDEIQAGNTPVPTLEPQFEKAVRELRALLNIDGVYIFPELPDNFDSSPYQGALI